MPVASERRLIASRRVSAGVLALSAGVTSACGGEPEADPVHADPVACNADDCLSRELATWPMPNPGTSGLPNPARLEPSEDVVRDGLTELEWTQSFAPLSTFEQAQAECAAAAAGEREDFRLPTRIELISLLDRTRTPAIDTRAFPATPRDYFWTATPLPDAPRLRYSVYFGAGETGSGDETQASAYVRCVRDGKRRPAPRYALDGELVNDLGTGLVWQRAASSVELSFTAAVAFCEDGAEPGFRLPSEKELQTLVTTDAAGGAALIDADAFPETPAGDYWTATREPVPPLVVSFTTGFAVVSDGAGTHFVRCVK